MNLSIGSLGSACVHVVEPPIAGSRVTVEVTLDDSFSTGTVTGNGDCNDYSAAITMAGNSISIADLERGETQCTDPAGIMEQEQRYTSALTVAESFSIDGDRLRIVYNSGDNMLEFVEAEE